MEKVCFGKNTVSMRTRSVSQDTSLKTRDYSMPAISKNVDKIAGAWYGRDDLRWCQNPQGVNFAGIKRHVQ